MPGPVLNNSRVGAWEGGEVSTNKTIHSLSKCSWSKRGDCRNPKINKKKKQKSDSGTKETQRKEPSERLGKVIKSWV